MTGPNIYEMDKTIVLVNDHVHNYEQLNHNKYKTFVSSSIYSFTIFCFLCLTNGF